MPTILPFSITMIWSASITVETYCTKGCPMQIPIPRYFTLFNQHKRDRWQANAKERYDQMLKTHAPASACVECRQCEQSCPQHIGICGWLKEVAQAFE